MLGGGWGGMTIFKSFETVFAYILGKLGVLGEKERGCLTSWMSKMEVTSRMSKMEGGGRGRGGQGHFWT